MRVLRSAPILSLLVVLGCSDPAPAVDAGSIDDGSADDASIDDASIDDGSADDASIDDASIDATTADASSIDGSAGDASRPDAGAMRSGRVSLQQSSSGGGTTNQMLSGRFLRAPIDDLRTGIAVGCAIDETSGPCSLVTCHTTTIPYDGAGELRASVGGMRAQTATADSNGSYVSYDTGAVFAAESVVTIEATGGVVPAFSADVIAPGPVAATLPSTIARSAPLTITWAVTSAESLRLSIVGSDGTGIICTVPAEDGTLTVDAALLDGLTAGSSVWMNATALNTAEITAGEYVIDVSVAQSLTMNGTIE